RSLDRNLDIAVQRLNPQINDIAIASVRSAYHPSLTTTVFGQSQTNAAQTTIAGSNIPGAAIEATQAAYNGGVAQNVPWGGGSLSVTLNNNRQTTTNLTTLYNPTYNTSWSGQYTQ